MASPYPISGGYPSVRAQLGERCCICKGAAEFVFTNSQFYTPYQKSRAKRTGWCWKCWKEHEAKCKADRQAELDTLAQRRALREQGKTWEEIDAITGEI